MHDAINLANYFTSITQILNIVYFNNVSLTKLNNTSIDNTQITLNFMVVADGVSHSK